MKILCSLMVNLIHLKAGHHDIIVVVVKSELRQRSDDRQVRYLRD